MPTSPDGLVIEGRAELQRALAKAAQDFKDLTDVYRDVGEVLVRGSRSRAPTLTGRLRASIHADVRPGSAEVYAGLPGEAYPGVQHFGWAEHNIEPTRYLFDAYDDQEQRLERLIEDGINRITDEI